MKTRLIFIRHGFSESNRFGLFTGQIDSPLTEKGHLQAKRAAEYLHDTKIDVVYTSPLRRAYDTGLPVAKERGLDVHTHNGLMEIHGGDWHEKPFTELGNLTPEAYKLWQEDLYNSCCPNGESVKDFVKRVHNAVTEIAEENKGKTVCIATHATPIRVICCFAMGLEPSHLKDVPWTPNASINIMDYEDGNFEFVQKDICDHLEGLETKLPEDL